MSSVIESTRKPVKNTAAWLSGRRAGSNYIAYIFVFLCSIVICRFRNWQYQTKSKSLCNWRSVFPIYRKDYYPVRFWWGPKNFFTARTRTPRPWSCPSVCLPVRLPVRPSVCPSVRPSVCPSICLSVHLFISAPTKSVWVTFNPLNTELNPICQ